MLLHNTVLGAARPIPSAIFCALLFGLINRMSCSDVRALDMKLICEVLFGVQWPYKLGFTNMSLYQPLKDDSNEIRLITIVPLKGLQTERSRIYCMLEHVSLDDQYRTRAYQLTRTRSDESSTQQNAPVAPITNVFSEQGLEDWIEVSSTAADASMDLPPFRYTWGDYLALSYTWGDPSHVEEISVNDQSIKITKNLADCLRTLRNKSYIKQGWKLWVDALCINQQDIIERGREVKRMREIYSKAWTPIVWLGASADGSDEAMSLIRLLSDTGARRRTEYINELTHALYRNPKLFGDGRWRALHQLAIRRYWSRIWIIQEAAMGRNNTPVLCGGKTISWIEIARTFALMNETDEIINVFIRSELKEAGIPFSYSIWTAFQSVDEVQWLQDRQHGETQFNLYRLLELGRTMFSTDPRDKIYGLLELMNPSLERLIKPDYTASVVDVYIDFAKATIEDTGLLDVIRLRYPSENTALPSWVPDWTVPRVNSPLNASAIKFRASGDSIANPRYLGKLISCRGFKLDSIDGMGALSSSKWSPSSIVNTIGSANPYGSVESIREAIWKTMTSNRNMNSEPTDDSYRDILATPALSNITVGETSPLKELTRSVIFTICTTILDGNASFRICGRELRDYLIDEIPSEEDCVLLRDGLMQVDRIGNRRQMFTTHGGYLGVAMESTKKTDGLYILQGCTMPVILRDLGDGQHFEYVGECYVHGLMHGEAMGWLEKGDRELQDVILC